MSELPDVSWPTILRNAANELDAAHAKIASLREALEPFAKYADMVAKSHEGWNHDGFEVGLPDALMSPEIDGTLKPFRRARRVLDETA